MANIHRGRRPTGNPQHRWQRSLRFKYKAPCYDGSRRTLEMSSSTLLGSALDAAAEAVRPQV